MKIKNIKYIMLLNSATIVVEIEYINGRISRETLPEYLLKDIENGSIVGKLNRL